MSRKRNSNGSNFRKWLRRTHRWLGLVALLFVLLLSVTGIALNHSSDWGLDRRFISAEWAARVLGIRAPEPAASYAAGGHRVTQIGNRIYFNDREIVVDASEVRGLVTLEPLAIVATRDSIILLTTSAEIIEHIDLAGELPGEIARTGSVDQRLVLDSENEWFVSDTDVTTFTPLSRDQDAGVSWSIATDPTDEEVASLKAQYRGRSVTVERLLIEIHSGRILGPAGPNVLDIVGIVMILLSLSGLVVWLSGRSRQSSRR